MTDRELHDRLRAFGPGGYMYLFEFGSTKLEHQYSKTALNQLEMFGQRASGGIFAIWLLPDGRRPVVYIGDEGENPILAPDFQTFAKIVGMGHPDPAFADTSAPPYYHDEDERIEGTQTRNWFETEFSVKLPKIADELFDDRWWQQFPDFDEWLVKYWIGDQNREKQPIGHQLGLRIGEFIKRLFTKT